MYTNRLQDLRAHTGFTLIEVLIVVAIVGIMLNIAVGNYGRLINGAQTQKTADNLKASLAQTRGESITRGGNVRICGSSDGNTCATSFDEGWISYYDKDLDAALGTDDTILSWYGVDYTGTTIAATDSTGTNTTDFGFNYRGYPVLPITLEVGGRGEEKTVQLHANGRVEIQ